MATYYILAVRLGPDGGVEEVEWKEIDPSRLPGNSPHPTVRAPVHEVFDAIERGDTVTYGKFQGGATYTPRTSLAINPETGALIASDMDVDWLDEVRKYQ